MEDTSFREVCMDLEVQVPQQTREDRIAASIKAWQRV